MPWFFNKHLIIFHYLIKREDHVQVLLDYTTFWVQIHNLSLGLMSEGLARQFGNFIGRFIEYDVALTTKGVRKFMRIKICLGVRLPLKRKKRLIYGQDSSTYVSI